ncbi:hypothetical protein BGZ54_005201 [Gamsiella multidivaricata]|nr:hypothetical protein BGZ54_005201 [Gamsiella multidivaricata]
MAVSAWRDVKATTIFNCFRHCNIRSESALLAPVEDNLLDQEAVNDLKQGQARLYRDPMDISALLNIPEENIIGEIPNPIIYAAEILAASGEEDIEGEELDSDDDAAEEPIVKSILACQMLDTIRLYFEQQDTDQSKNIAATCRMRDFADSRRVSGLQQTTLLEMFAKGK